MKAYELARMKALVQKIIEMLDTIKYTYPYHQVIGFYLDRAGGYREEEVNELLEFGLDYDFYLVHQMDNRNYSKKWRLHYPSKLDDNSK